MIAAGDQAYIATADYRNGPYRFRAGQFVVLTDPEGLGLLQRDGFMDSLVPIDRAAFIEARPAPAENPQPEPVPDAAEEPETTDADTEDEDAAEEPEPEQTIAAGRRRGNNRMTTGTRTGARSR